MLVSLDCQVIPVILASLGKLVRLVSIVCLYSLARMVRPVRLAILYVIANLIILVSPVSLFILLILVSRLALHPGGLGRPGCQCRLY